jgi:hypothetical protein
MPSDDSLHDLIQIELPDTVPLEENNACPRDAHLVDRLRIASPCNASWEEMEGDDLVRFCRLCQLNVYNISEMSRGNAAAFIREAKGRLCVRFYRRQDGTLLTEDCPVGWRAARRRLLNSIGSSLAVAGCSSWTVA